MQTKKYELLQQWKGSADTERTKCLQDWQLVELAIGGWVVGRVVERIGAEGPLVVVDAVIDGRGVLHRGPLIPGKCVQFGVRLGGLGHGSALAGRQAAGRYGC